MGISLLTVKTKGFFANVKHTVSMYVYIDPQSRLRAGGWGGAERGETERREGGRERGPFCVTYMQAGDLKRHVNLSWRACLQQYEGLVH